MRSVLGPDFMAGFMEDFDVGGMDLSALEEMFGDSATPGGRTTTRGSRSRFRSRRGKVATSPKKRKSGTPSGGTGYAKAEPGQTNKAGRQNAKRVEGLNKKLKSND
jgi:hypothetical protein